MISAVIPIRIADNSFWSSTTGLESIRHFLDMVCSVNRIDERIILTSDNSILRIAGEYGIATPCSDNARFQDSPYIFEECLLFAKKCFISSQKNNDRFIVLDHRNFSLQIDNIENAISIHGQNPDCCVLSLSLLNDYPCQCKTFFFFLGCEILHFRNQNVRKESFLDRFEIDYYKEAGCELKDGSRIKFYVTSQASLCSIVFRNNDQVRDKLVARIIPFDFDGPLYEYAHEIQILPWEHEIKLDIEIENITGLIFLFTSPSQTGEYDSVELFAPSKAPWKWSGKGGEMINPKTGEPLLGRQQFPAAYTYDGSICLLNRNHLVEKAPLKFMPVHIENSFIVMDWVDYYCGSATQNIGDN